MEGDDKKGLAFPTNMEEAVLEFVKARQDRIAKRRSRIAEKMTAAKNAEGPNNAEPASIASSLEFLTGLDEKEGEETHVDTADGSKKYKKEKKEKDETKKSHTATDHLDVQIDESRKQLEQMILDGEVLITNVKVAVEYREKQRQKKQDESYKERLDRLRKESEECNEMYQNLSQNWDMKAEKVLPMELYTQLKAQQEACDDLLTKKEDLIIAMRREIEENDFQYDGNLEKYQKDSMLMGDRIDDLVDDLRVAFIEELNLIEDYTCRNREVILEDNQNEWMELLQDFEKSETKNLEERKSDAVAKFESLNDLFIMTKQESRNIRHKMEDDLRTLVQEREQIKYACHLNLEKMAYNLHILQCRSKENVELKNMMKRFLLKLHDKFDSRAASLKKKMDTGKRQCDKMIKEIERLEQQVSTFGQKTLHLSLADQRKYVDLWIANEELVRDKVQSLLKTEKFIFETQLGIDFPLPDLKSFEDRPKEVNLIIQRKNPNVSVHETSKAKKSKRSSVASDIEDDDQENVESELFVKTPEKEPKIACVGNRSLLIMKTDSLEFIPGPDPDPAIQSRLMKSIAKVICDQSGFIVEEELQKILQPLVKTEQSLVTLTSVFQCLGINSVDEMQSLARYMLKYCKTMKGVMSKMDSQASAGLTEMNVSMTGVIGKAAFLDDLSSKSSETQPSTELASKTESETFEECLNNPATYCQCICDETLKLQEIRSKKEAKNKRKKFLKRQKNGIPGHPSEIKMEKTEESETITNVESAGVVTLNLVLSPIITTIATTKKAENFNFENLDCSDVCFSPINSLEKVINQVEDDEELLKFLDAATEYELFDEEEEDDDEEEESDYDQGSAGAFVSNKATVLSWLDSEDRRKIVGNLSIKYRTQPNEEEEEETEEINDLQERKAIKEAEKAPIDDEQVSIVHNLGENEFSSDDAGVFDDESKTISIPDYDSCSDASDEFLYIDPEDVVFALKNFIEDYDNRKKIVLPTLEEIISRKLENIKYPARLNVAEYWEKAIHILNPKGKSMWEVVQYSFDEYNKVLKDRNEFVDEIGKLYTQNYELSHLLQKHLHAGAKHSRSSNHHGGHLGYC